MLLFITLLIAAGALGQLLRHALSEPPPAVAPTVRMLGWLDDDGAPRGERWDGSPLLAPRPAFSH